ncbi:MAG: hypothetical protein VXW24_07490 [Bacteroidota bacterium]|nr:hypothetical protein [Bacteroidota bacterium]
MCERLELTYYGRATEETIAICPEALIRIRGYQGYDKKHMDFFKTVGMATTLILRNTGYGWFEVGCLQNADDCDDPDCPIHGIEAMPFRWAEN